MIFDIFMFNLAFAMEEVIGLQISSRRSRYNAPGPYLNTHVSLKNLNVWKAFGRHSPQRHPGSTGVERWRFCLVRGRCISAKEWRLRRVRVGPTMWGVFRPGRRLGWRQAVTTGACVTI